MFNFKKLVHNILLEAEPTINPVDPQQDNTNDIQNIQKSPGFMRVVGAYTSQYNQTPVIRDILKAVNVIVGGGYIAAKYTAVGDLLTLLHKFIQK
jgi:negative regulator of sigma E activity